VKRFGIAAVALVTMLGLPQAPALAWTVAVVDADATDSPPSVALSLSDHVWVAWEHDGTNDLFWSTWTGTAWSTSQVAGVGTAGCNYEDTAPSARFDPNDGTARIASICYDDNGSGHRFTCPPTAWIRWTFRNPTTGSWGSEKIAGVPKQPNCASTTAANLSLAFDPATGLPAISFGSTATGGVYWLAFDGTAWNLQEVTTPRQRVMGRSALVSAAFEPATGQPYVAWVAPARNFDQRLRYSQFDTAADTWRTRVLAEDVAWDAGAPSLAFASDRKPWIAYTSAGSKGDQLSLASRAAGVWTLSALDDTSANTGVDPSVAIKGTLPRIAYHDAEVGTLRYAAFSGTSWTLSTIDAATPTGLDPALAFSSALDPYILYRFASGNFPQGIAWARPSG
jgi:hypothetical protein